MGSNPSSDVDNESQVGSDYNHLQRTKLDRDGKSNLQSTASINSNDWQPDSPEVPDEKGRVRQILERLENILNKNIKLKQEFFEKWLQVNPEFNSNQSQINLLWTIFFGALKEGIEKGSEYELEPLEQTFSTDREFLVYSIGLASKFQAGNGNLKDLLRIIDSQIEILVSFGSSSKPIITGGSEQFVMGQLPVENHGNSEIISIFLRQNSPASRRTSSKESHSLPSFISPPISDLTNQPPSGGFS